MPARKKGATSPSKSDKSSSKSQISKKSDKSDEKKKPAAKKKAEPKKAPADKKKAAQPPPPTSLTKIDMTGVKYPLKEIFMRFLEHTDSAEQQISDEITLRFPPTIEDKEKEEVLISNLCPTTFTIHETFPILLLQDGTHFASFALTKDLYDKLKANQMKT